MPKRYDVVAIVGKRSDDKPNYVNCGAVFEKNGKFSMKLDSIPAGGEWNGWFQLFTPKGRDDAPRGGGSAPPPPPPPDTGPNDDIPF